MLQTFYKKTVTYDLLNKFNYTQSKNIPEIEKIVLNFSCKNNDMKYLAASLLALELIAKQKSKMSTTKRSNILLKLRKGNPVGCKVTLRKKSSIFFLSKLITEIFPRLKNFNGFKTTKKIRFFSYKLQDTFSFHELEKHYYLFNALQDLNVTIITNTKIKEELSFILNSFKFPFK